MIKSGSVPHEEETRLATESIKFAAPTAQVRRTRNWVYILYSTVRRSSLWTHKMTKYTCRFGNQ